MQFLHKREYLNAGDTVVVNCDHQCNVMLMEDHDFQAFRSGRAHNYRGGFFQRLPVHLAVPHSGWWNVTLDLGGRSARIRHSFGVIRA